MKKAEFLKRLRKKLSKLPPEERRRVLEYYGELIDDEIERGRSEVEAVSRRGTAEEIARRTVAEYLENQRGSKQKAGGGFASRLAVVLVSFPLWLPVYIAVWAVLISLAVSAVAMVLGGILGVIPFGALVFSHPAVGWVQIGVCLACAGLGGFLAVASWTLCRRWIQLSGWLLHGIRWSFHKGEEVI